VSKPRKELFLYSCELGLWAREYMEKILGYENIFIDSPKYFED
jgi:hypothetical protein